MNMKMPQALSLTHSDDILHCETILRHLPGKRITLKGRWRDQPVVAKLFLNSQASDHKTRELQGHKLLKQCGLLTPDILYEGSLEKEKSHLLIFQYLEKTRDSRAEWNNPQVESRIQFSKKITSILAALHNQGIVSCDLHPNNFLIFHEDVYVVDAASLRAKSAGRALSKTEGLKNLAQLFAQVAVIHDEDVIFLLEHYLGVRKLISNGDDLHKVIDWRNQYRLKREKKYLEKIFRDCTRYVVHSTFTSRFACDREFDSPVMQALIANIDPAMQQGKLLKAGNSNTLSSVLIDNHSLVIKRYNIKNFTQRLKRWFMKNRAVNCWEQSQRLYFHHVPVAKPVALFEEKWSLFRKRVYYISEKLNGITLAETLSNPGLSDHELHDIAHQLKIIFYAMKRLKVSHGDLKATNFIVSGGQVYVTDLDAMKKHHCYFSLEKALQRDRERFLANWKDERILNAFKHAFSEQEIV